MNREQKNARQREYNQMNRDKINARQREYNKRKKVEMSVKRKLTYEKKKQDDPDFMNSRNERERGRYAKWKESLTDEGKHKLHRKRLKGNWVKGGFKHTEEEFEDILDRYFASDKCESCGVCFDDKHIKNADHDHNSGCFRNIVCRKCNCYRAKHDYHFLKVLLEIHRSTILTR